MAMTGRKVLLLIATAGIVAMLWKEFPAMVRYYKIERM
jgi:hypothetical protein